MKHMKKENLKWLVVVSNPRFEKFFDFFFEIRRPHSTEETSTDEEKFGFDIWNVQLQSPILKKKSIFFSGRPSTRPQINSATCLALIPIQIFR